MFYRKLNKIIYRNYFGRNCFKIYKRLGFDLLLNYSNHIDRKIIYKAAYEADQLLALISHAQISKPDFFIDVGANIGIYSLLAAKTDLFASIVAFEPDRRNYAQLRANILLNGFHDKISTYEKGLSDQNASIKFYQNIGSSTGTSRIASTAPQATKLDKFESTTISVVRLDDVLQEGGKTIFFKIDIEGHESASIDGMINLLSNNQCRVQVEVFDENFEQVNGQFNAIGYSLCQEFGADKIYSNKDPFG